MTVLFAALALIVGAAPSAGAAPQHAQTQAAKAASPSGYSSKPYCSSHSSLCADTYDSSGYYVGHDEPSVEFKSGLAGSGNDVTYTLTLPTDPRRQPHASGAGSSAWN